MESHITSALMIVVALLASFMGTISLFVSRKRSMSPESLVGKSPRSYD